MSAAKAGRPVAQAVTRWRRCAAASVASSVQGEKRQKDISVTYSGHVSEKYNSDLEPACSTGWGGAGRAAPAPTGALIGRGGCENNGMAASQTELPYCSDEGTGRGGGGMAQEVDTPAPAAVGAASVTTSRQRVS